jgi:ABC-2 type transport system permease protein
VAEVWLRLAGARVRSQVQYRASFALIIVSTFAFSFLDFLAIIVIFSNVKALGGWSFVEVALLYGTSGVSFNLANVFVAGIDRAAEHIRRGSFDTYLIRPLGPAAQLTANDIEPRRFGRLAQASVVLVVALARVDVDWTVGRVLAVPLLLVSGMAIFGAIWVIVAAIAFWTVDNRSFANSVTYGGNHLTMYPLDVVSGAIRSAVIFIPLAFVNYLPVASLLGKDTPYDWPQWIGLTSPLVAIATCAVARAVWRVGVRHYRSTGS